VLFREVFDVVSKGAGCADGRGLEEFGVDSRAGRTAIVDGPACSEGGKTTSGKVVKYENPRASSMAIPCVESGDETALYFGELSCTFDFAESLLPLPKTRLSHLIDKLSLIASVSTFDEKRASFQWWE
jgi:hypothetical protein